MKRTLASPQFSLLVQHNNVLRLLRCALNFLTVCGLPVYGTTPLASAFTNSIHLIMFFDSGNGLGITSNCSNCLHDQDNYEREPQPLTHPCHSRMCTAVTVPNISPEFSALCDDNDQRAYFPVCQSLSNPSQPDISLNLITIGVQISVNVSNPDATRQL